MRQVNQVSTFGPAYQGLVAECSSIRSAPFTAVHSNAHQSA